jgi:flagellar basal-body rod protein FlgB
MSLDLGGVTMQLMGIALDAAMLRHDVIANNIANHDTPGFKTKRLRFEALFSDTIMQLKDENGTMLKSRIGLLRDSIQDGSMVVSENEPVELDREMVRLSENTLWYQAILKVASKHGELLRLAVNGGRQ